MAIEGNLQRTVHVKQSFLLSTLAADYSKANTHKATIGGQ